MWLKEHGRDYADFEWHGGYADFSVSQSNLEQVKQYIAGQEENHRKIGFQDELRALLRKHEIEWDEMRVIPARGCDSDASSTFATTRRAARARADSASRCDERELSSVERRGVP
jgi:hypothetical protein